MGQTNPRENKIAPNSKTVNVLLSLNANASFCLILIIEAPFEVFVLTPQNPDDKGTTTNNKLKMDKFSSQDGRSGIHPYLVSGHNNFFAKLTFAKANACHLSIKTFWEKLKISCYKR